MAARPTLTVARKQRPGTEYLCEYAFRPLAQLVVVVLLPLRVRPPLVVLVNATAGLAASAEIWRGDLLAGALLLQLKTVLDNADGQLARASGRVTAFGRYLDSESDLVVNAAVFAAIAHTTGQPWLALVGFVLLTLVTSADFNFNRLYREGHGQIEAAPPGTGAATRALAAVYAVMYGWQDQLTDAYVARRLASRDVASRLAYHDSLTVSILANFGMSTQLAALGLCLAVGHPTIYVAVIAACAITVVALLARRERRAALPAPVR